MPACAAADAVAALIATGALLPGPLPGATPAFVAWVGLGAVAQLGATAFLIGAMEQRSFVVGWFTAFAMRSAVDVRIVGLAEVFFSYALTRRFFVEPVTAREGWGIVLVVAGIIAISSGR